MMLKKHADVKQPRLINANDFLSCLTVLDVFLNLEARVEVVLIAK